MPTTFCKRYMHIFEIIFQVAMPMNFRILRSRKGKVFQLKIEDSNTTLNFSIAEGQI